MFKSDEKTMNDRDAKKISELVQQLKPMVNKMDKDDREEFEKAVKKELRKTIE